MAPTIERPITTAELSEMIGIPESTLRFYRARRIGPRSYKLGRKTVYDLADVREWMRARKARSLQGEGVPI